jgi:hypothetical protein
MFRGVMYTLRSSCHKTLPLTASVCVCVRARERERDVDVESSSCKLNTSLSLTQDHRGNQPCCMPGEAMCGGFVFYGLWFRFPV